MSRSQKARPRSPQSERCPADRRRPHPCGRKSELHGQSRRDRLPGGRIRLGQVGDRLHRHGPAGQGAEADLGRDPARGRERAGRRRDAAARTALHAHVDDLPGADDGAQPGHDLRPADRRGAGDPHQARRRPAQGQDHRHPDAGEAAGAGARLRLLSAPALGRPAPAHHDRHGAGARSRAADRRRADDGARRHDPGRDPEADRRAAGRPGHRRAVHHPRFRRGRRDRPSGRRAALGRAGGDGPDRADPVAPAATLHQDADLLGAVDPSRASRRAQGRHHRAAHREARQDLQRQCLLPEGAGREGRGRRRSRHPPRRDAGHRGRIGLGQIDGGALHRPADRPDRRQGVPGRHRDRHHVGGQAPAASPAGADRLPGSLPLDEPAHHDRRIRSSRGR